MRTTMTNEPVPFHSLGGTYARLKPEIDRHVHEVIDRGKYSHGAKVGELEAAMRAYVGADHAIAVNSGTDALVLLLRAAGVRPGDEVVVPCFTFIASASAVVLVGATPVFVDIEDGGYGLDVQALDDAMTDRTRAVMPVHMFHDLADLDQVAAVAARHDLLVLEDSAEAVGMRWGDRHAGMLGQGGVLSFFPTKTLGAIGDAGMIVTDDDDIARHAKITRHHGRMGKTIDHIAGISNLSGESGTNSKMDDLQAAVLMARLGTLDAEIKRRAELAGLYHERLDGRPGIRRAPVPLPRSTPTTTVFYVYVVEADDRDGLAAHLTAQGIGTETYYPRPLHLQPCFEHLPYREGAFPRAEESCRHTLALPFFPDMSDDQVETVCEAIGGFYGWQ